MASSSHHGPNGRPYLMFWINMALGFVVMYAVMFTMIDGWGDFRNNINMVWMTLTMWAPMGIFMLATMPGMFTSRRANMALVLLFAAVTAGSFWATRAQALVGDRQFIQSMIPHHSGAILMCRQATLTDPELIDLCHRITASQGSEIDEMEAIGARLP